MDERNHRQARNEAFLRDVNERMATFDHDAQGSWVNGTDGRFAFQCECGQSPTCGGQVELTLGEYEQGAPKPIASSSYRATKIR